MEENGFFKINMNSNYFSGCDEFSIGKSKGVVLTPAKRKWYKMLWQFITFGKYKAPYEYLIKPCINPQN